MTADAGTRVPPLRWDGERLHVLDQTRLPHAEEVLVLTGAEDTAEAIERLAVRGAPLIGVTAAYGLAMAVAAEPTLGALERAAERLASARPTARNLGVGGRARPRGRAGGRAGAHGRRRPRRGRGDPRRGRGRQRRPRPPRRRRAGGALASAG